MDKRKEKILNTLIKEHIQTGQPVGSEALVNKYRLAVSPATVRNEMAELEEAGFIIQPHTSAGRVPTEKAYSYYLNNFKEKKLSYSEEKFFNDALSERNERALRETAKAIAKLSGQAVFWAFYRHNLFYTGLANLLSQPEFSQSNLVYDISAIIDRLDEVIDEIFDTIEFSPTVMLGSENPFSPVCSTIITKYRRDDKIGLFGILGPLRMNYEKNIALVKFVNDKLIL